MPSSLGQVLAFASIPVATMAGGGAVAAFRPPAPRVRSYVQHFAAGLVFAAAAVEVLPDVMHRKAPLAAGIGFAVGVALMLAIREVARRLGAEGEATSGDGRGEGVWGMVGVIGIDILVDGLLIGVTLAGGQRAGLLVTVALGVELFSLGLATAAALGKRRGGRARAIVTTSVLALLPAAGAVIGYRLLGGLTGGWMEAVLAFAVAALLYLVTEELLVEAHEVPETPLTTAMFFVGFLALLLIDMIA